MAEIIRLKEIKNIVQNIDIIATMEEGFIVYSNGNTKLNE